MSPDAYLQMAATEEEHWWFRGRREVLRTVLSKLNLRADARILEIGSGTGGNLNMLAEFGSVCGLEMDETARNLAVQKTGWRFDIRAGRCPDELPFHGQRFDVVCFFDCLEHIADDVDSLERMQKLLSTDGMVLVTVPACRWLWSAHDVFLHHHRRYSKPSLIACARAAGYKVEVISHFNTLLFPLAVIARCFDKVFRRRASSGDAIPIQPVNSALYRIFKAECSWLSHHSFPFGVSLFAVLTRDVA
jgi:SAM-dependent methyltransferase